MFTYKHYVPVIKWKKSERAALSKIGKLQRDITPIIEFVPNDEDKTSLNIDNAPSDIYNSWGTDPIFIDLNLLNSKIQGNSMQYISESPLNLKLIPIINSTSSDEVIEMSKKLALKSNLGIGLRITKSNLINNNSIITTMLNKNRLDINHTHLILDLQESDFDFNYLNNLLLNIPNIQDWKTLTLLSGSFVKDLGKYRVGLNYLERKDWELWKQHVDNKYIRSCAFGDYINQFPIYLPSPNYAGTASIRYTVGNNWIIMKGESLGGEDIRKAQLGWLANAKLLTNNPEFCGKDFSFGDNFIFEKSELLGDSNANTGSSKDWRIAGINHHLTFVCHQLSSLP